MNKSSDQIRDIIVNWLEPIQIRFENVTEIEKQKNQQLDWIIKVADTLVIYMMKGRSDRINFDCPINFADEHQIAAGQLPDNEFTQFIIQINESLLMIDLTTKYVADKKRIKQISICSYIDTDSLTREKFYKNIDRIAAAKDITIKKIQVKFGVTGILPSSSTNLSDKLFYG